MSEKGLEKLCCLLTSKELQQRKLIVLNSLKTQILSGKELSDGYSFTFPGNDAVLDELNEFIKTERACCPFFTFQLVVPGSGNEAQLNLTGPNGVKDFIRDELGFVTHDG